MSGSILIVDDLSINRTILRARLSAAHYTCLMAATGQSAIDIARAEQPDLILMDYGLPDMNGADVCQALRSGADTCDIPLLLFSASTDRDLRLRALAAGADDFLAKPIDDSYLMGRMRSLLRLQDARPSMADMPASCASGRAPVTGQVGRDHQIVLVSDLPETLVTALADVLPRGGLVPLSSEQALRFAPGQRAPDLILLGQDVVQVHGLQIVSELRARAGTRDADICLLLPPGHDLLASMALDLGATEVLRLPLDPDEASLRLRAVLRNRDRSTAHACAVARQLSDALRDPLTGLFNRRQMIAELWRLAMAAGSGAASAGAILVLDLDHFKTVNDRFGHVAGDDVLIDLSRRLRASLRKADLLARYGGEEFVVLLPGANLAVARQIAERMGHAVQSAPCLPHVDGGGIRVTASIGVALIPSVQPGQTPEQFARQTIETADTALRAAKHGGRNRIVAEARAVFA